jgi:hypothetical protein
VHIVAILAARANYLPPLTRAKRGCEDISERDFEAAKDATSGKARGHDLTLELSGGAAVRLE